MNRPYVPARFRRRKPSFPTSSMRLAPETRQTLRDCLALMRAVREAEVYHPQNRVTTDTVIALAAHRLKHALTTKSRRLGLEPGEVLRNAGARDPAEELSGPPRQLRPTQDLGPLASWL